MDAGSEVGSKTGGADDSEPGTELSSGLEDGSLGVIMILGSEGNSEGDTEKEGSEDG